MNPIKQVNQVNAQVRQIGSTATAGVDAVRRLQADLGLGNVEQRKAFFESLAPASYRGVKFAVLTSKGAFGRRNVVHEYPFRDTPWIEDLGRGTRRITVQGFLLEGDAKLGGGTLQSQINRLITACETYGEGKLIHPQLGELAVGLLSPVEIETRWDKGRAAFVTFVFIENGLRLFPAIVSSPEKTTAAAASATGAATKTFGEKALAALEKGAMAASAAINEALYWTNKADKLVNNATNIFNLAKTLTNQVITAVDALTPKSRPVVMRSTVAAASTQLNTAATAMSANTVDAFSAAAVTVVDAIADSAVSQDDASRILAGLADLPSPAAALSDAPGSQAVADMAAVSNRMFRRLAVIALARSTASYQPVSHDDAFALRDRVTALLDIEIAAAGDLHEDDVFLSLRNLRSAVYQDLTERGASLAPLREVKTGRPMPAPVLALRLYRDTGRADELIAMAAPIHPAFMPVSFLAKSE